MTWIGCIYSIELKLGVQVKVPNLSNICFKSAVGSISEENATSSCKDCIFREVI